MGREGRGGGEDGYWTEWRSTYASACVQCPLTRIRCGEVIFPDGWFFCERKENEAGGLSGLTGLLTGWLGKVDFGSESRV